jgi:hypothetical protein
VVKRKDANSVGASLDISYFSAYGAPPTNPSISRPYFICDPPPNQPSGAVTPECSAKRRFYRLQKMVIFSYL